MNFEEKAREQAKYAADLTQCGIVMTSEEIYNAVHKFVHAALVSAYEMGCQAGSIAKGEGSSEPAVPLQSGEGAEALKRRIARAICVAVQFKEFGHSDGEDFVTTGQESERLELACNEAAAAVLKMFQHQTEEDEVR